MLSGITGLILAVATFITSVTGLVGMILVARRTSPREREDAAQQAAVNVLNPSPPQAVQEAAALVELHPTKRKRLRRGR